VAVENEVDVVKLLAVACNLAFDRHGNPNRIEIVSGRRKRF
jgi:hypothetical protein